MRFTIAAAELLPDNAASVGAAVACERSGGHEGAAARWLALQKTDADRARVEKEAAKAVALEDDVNGGDIAVDATWEGNVDLDLGVVDPAGGRLGWMSARRVRARDTSSLSHEVLVVPGAGKGTHTIEIVRASAGPEVRGTLRIKTLGVTRELPFVLGGMRTQVARVDIRSEARWVER